MKWILINTLDRLYDSCMIDVKIDCNCNLENKGNYLKNSEVGYSSNCKINITLFVDYI